MKEDLHSFNHMENKSGHRHESGSATKGYLLFNEETLNFFLYGNRKVRVIDVNKLKRNAENHQGRNLMSCTMHQGYFIVSRGANI